VFKTFSWLLVAAILTTSLTGASPSSANSITWPESVDLPAGSPSSNTEQDVSRALIAAMKQNKLAPDITPALKLADARSIIYSDRCMEQRGQTYRPNCVYGDPNGENTIWLIGDSHAAQWFYAVNDYAKSKGFRLVVHAKSSCQPQVQSNNKWNFPACAGFNEWLLHAVSEAKPDVLVVGLYSGILKLIEPNVLHRLSSLAGFAAKTVLIGDTPKRAKYPPTCLRQNSDDVHFCDTQESKAFDAKMTVDTQTWARNNHAKYMDVRNWFCIKGECPATVGNLMLFRDFTHITGVAATWYSKVFSHQMDEDLQAR